MPSLTNKIVANIKKTNADVNSFVNTNNVVCIDTSNNRIGINTRTPRYSIDISGLGPTNVIYVNKMIVSDNATIGDISCTNNIDASGAFIRHINYTSISGSTIKSKQLITISAEIVDLCINNIRLNTLAAYRIDSSLIYINNGGILAGDISINNLVITGRFSGGNNTSFTELNLTTSKIDTMNSTNSFIKNIDCSSIKVDTSANFNGLTNINNIINISYGSFQTLSGNILKATSIIGTTISCEHLGTKDCSINGTLTVSNIKDLNGNDIIRSGGLVVSTGTSVFSGLTVSDILKINNSCDISNLKITRKLDFSNNASLIMPTYFSNTLIERKSIAVDISDSSMNIIKYYNTNNSWSNIYTKNHYASLDIKREISGNDISSITQNTQISYFIAEASNLRINLINNNYKYIPLDFKLIGSKVANSGRDIFKIVDISSNKPSGKLIVPDISGVYEINASVSMKYLNRIPGDVEPNTYCFGLYNSILDSDISYIYLENMNNILTFDNSFNYSSSSLNYIGPLFNNGDGFIFLISSAKDLDYLAIDRFNGSIKLLNY